MITTPINGREALPLRAIPAATNNFFSPWEVVGLLLDPEAHYSSHQPTHMKNHPTLPLAQRVLTDGGITFMRPAEHLAWTSKLRPENILLRDLPVNIFAWADELRSLVAGIAVEIQLNARLNDREPPRGYSEWNTDPYLSAEDAQLVQDSLQLIQHATSSNRPTSPSGKHIKIYGRGPKGVDIDFQQLANAKANKWRTEGKRGNDLSKVKIAKAIADEGGFNPATVCRVIRQRWSKS